MNINNQQIVCVGNSHLASFSKALKSALLDIENVSLKFWPVLYMSIPWDNFKVNNFLSSPKFKADNPANLPNTDVILQNKSILVLVGLGLSGSSIFTHFGKLAFANPGEMKNGFSCSPLMPYVYGNGINKLAATSHLSKRGAPCYSVNMCKKMFESSINNQLNKLLHLSSNSPFRHVYSVPAPNMPDMGARWRLGEDYCDSGCQRVINDTYRETLDELILKVGVSENVITHNISFENELGFIDNKYTNSHALNDNHVNPTYYEHIVSELLGRIANLNTSAVNSGRADSPR